MIERVLVTGGAGFIGSHLVDALVTQGHRVRAFDNLEPQACPEHVEGYTVACASRAIGPPTAIPAPSTSWAISVIGRRCAGP